MAATNRHLLWVSTHQPWATLFALGLKCRMPDGCQIETRSWPIRAIGAPIAIHAGKRWTSEQRAFYARFRTLAVRAKQATWETFPAKPPLGAVVAIGWVQDCRPTWVHDSSGQLVEASWLDQLDAVGLAAGDFSPNRFGWFLHDVVPLREPYPVRGEQGVRTMPREHADAVTALCPGWDQFAHRRSASTITTTTNVNAR